MARAPHSILTFSFADVAALGLNIATVVNGQASTVGGTSAAAPIIAGHLALLNNYRQQNGKDRVGWIQPKFYSNPSALSDITSGKTAGCEDSSVSHHPRVETLSMDTC